MNSQAASQTGVQQQGRPKLKHEQLRETVKARIQSGQYKAGDRLPSEADLAQEMNISRHTILRALSSLTAEGWIERQQGRGTFVTEGPRQTEMSGQTVALICSDQGDALMSRVIQGMSRALRASRRELLVLDSDHDEAREEELLGSLLHRKVGGAILWPWNPRARESQVRALVEQRFPLVVMDQSIDWPEVPLVSVDHELGAYEVTRHLLEQGHRRIAHITFQEESPASRPAISGRKAGYCRALAEWGVAYDESLVKYVEPALMKLSHKASVCSMLGYEQMHQLVQGDNPPTAVFLLNDIFASSVFRVLANHGLRVPEDVAVAGFNNDPTIRGPRWSLTSYDAEPEKQGYVAAELVTQLTRSWESPQRRHILPGKLVVRHSTDPSIQSPMSG